MFEQHPVPQNISSYQFHLVGDMTLKQFLELAAGVVIGVLFYASGLPGFIKWPLIFISAAGGAALAFVPFEERPLEQWIIAFFRSVYSPTLFYWKKIDNAKYFQDETFDAGASLTQTQQSKPSVFGNIPFLNKLEESENTYLNKLTQLFSPGATTPITQGVTQSTGLINQAPTPAPAVQAPIETKREVSVPRTTYISLDKSQRPGMVVEEISQDKTPVDLTPAAVTATLQGEAISGLKQAQFSVNAAPPSLPTIINTVSGQVMDSSGNIIEGAILEIRDESGRPVRALKTNRAGHFLIVTQLTPGKYQIVTEKEGYSFDPIEFEAAGAIIMPIAIKARPNL